jgi:hypothetical protein
MLMFTKGRPTVSRRNSSQENTIRVSKRKTAWCKALFIALLTTGIRSVGMPKPDKSAAINKVIGSMIHLRHVIRDLIS